jgi:ubiquinol-cytochrome c reductase cytochrome b subunit
LLALIYSPSANEAWTSLNFLNHNIALGWYVRALHGWGSDFMIAIVLIHMVQVFLFGAYKFPRELTWIVGVGLLLLTLGMAFTGQVMRFDQDAYWGLGIGASIVSRVPFVGAQLVHLVLGGPIIGGATLSRFFTLHVFVIPGLLLAGVGVHVWMVLYHGVSDWPMPGRLVRKSTYEREYHELVEKTGIPFVPDAAWKDAVFAAAILLAVMACAFFFGPFGPGGQPDPTIIQTAPKPDFFFLWIYAVLAFLPPTGDAGAADRSGDWDCRNAYAAAVRERGREALVAAAGCGVDGFGDRGDAGVFTRLGTYTPWSPVMDAWSSDAVPVKYMRGRTPLERQGAMVLQDKQCRNCHELDGAGGSAGRRWIQ